MKSNFSISSGFHFDQNESYVNHKFNVSDSEFNHYDTTYIPVLDSNGATIGSNNQLNPIFELTVNEIVSQSKNRIKVFSIPSIYIGYSTRVFNKLYLDVNSGFLLSGTANIIDPKFIHFGFKVCLRPQIRYEFKNFGISINTSIGYDVILAMNWSGAKRNRFYSNFEVGLHYLF